MVTDVCSRCNNELLSELDSYFCTLYDEFFAELRGFDSTVTFQFAFDLLARSLLKIAYNSARAAGSDHEYLRQVRSYVLAGHPRPRQLAIFLEIVSPSKVKDESSAGRRAVFPQNLYRSAITKLLTPNGDRVRTRIVAINSFYFHVVLPAATMSDLEFEEAANELGEYLQGVVRLSPDVREAVLTTSPQDAISSLVPHIQRHAVTYREFFDRKKS